MSNQQKKQESVKNLLFVVFVATACFIRNTFFPDEVVPRYSLIPYRWNGPFIRITNNYFPSAIAHERDGKEKKTLRRNIFFNLIRNLLPDFVRQLLMSGRLNAERNI